MIFICAVTAISELLVNILTLPFDLVTPISVWCGHFGNQLALKCMKYLSTKLIFKNDVSGAK